MAPIVEFDATPLSNAPLPRWCQPPPAPRPRYRLDDVPHTGNLLPAHNPWHKHNQRQKASGHGL